MNPTHCTQLRYDQFVKLSKDTKTKNNPKDLLKPIILILVFMHI